MGLECILAMTAAEISHSQAPVGQIAWMACHFSSYGLGLSNLPRQLPSGSLLIVNDRTPIDGHDPQLIRSQLTECGQALDIGGIILDFQRPDNRETAALVQTLATGLCWPVAVSELYAGTLGCAVFLSAAPPHRTLTQHLQPWQDREIWLEVALETELATVTAAGCTFQRGPVSPLPEPWFSDDQRHMCYHMAVSANTVSFAMARGKAQFPALLQQAGELGVSKAVGLYQQLGPT